MGSRTGRVAWIASAVLMLATGARAAEAPTLVVHLADYEHVAPQELAEAKTLVGGVYARIGVHLLWTTGSARLAPRDGYLHVDIVILDTTMTAATKPAPGVVGVGSHTAKRASNLYPRVFAQAIHSQDRPALALALTMAHELGHVVLPDYSHSSSGLMRADWDGHIGTLPNFLPLQATKVRNNVLASHN